MITLIYSTVETFIELDSELYADDKLFTVQCLVAVDTNHLFQDAHNSFLINSKFSKDNYLHVTKFIVPLSRNVGHCWTEICNEF